MADCRRYIPNPHLDLEQIQQEAQHRWLRPTEICELLRNYHKFQLRSDPPVKPPAGSLFLFDRKVQRYFRKDGHQWRKKKDGKTVKEAHEKLKAGSVDVLHCYYAHGEDNANFQRRSYWMLDEQFENIVLVHYREIKEGYKSGTPSLLNTNSESQHGCHQSIPCSLEQTYSPDTTFQTSYASGPNSVDWPEQTVSSGMEDGDFGEGPGATSFLQPSDGSLPLDTCLHPSGTNGLLELPRYHFDIGVAGASCNNGSTSSTWAEFNGSNRNTSSLHEPQFYINHQLTRDDLDARVDTDRTAQEILSFGDGLTTDSRNGVQVHSHSQAASFSIAKSENCKQVDILRNEEVGELKKLDSFGRWMDKEIGGDCDDSLMASDSGNYWNALNTENDDKEVSSLSRHMQLDTDSVGPSLSQEQLFSICDFAPDWAYSGVQTKVLITGTFLGDQNLTNSFKWCCMFGEIEVSAEVVANNAIRCQVPFHAPGRVPFYITCSNRLACSEVREFEYLERPSQVAHKSMHEDDVSLQIRLTKLLSSGCEKRSDCSVDCKNCGVKILIQSLKIGYESNWKRIEEEICKGNSLDLLVQELLKDKLYEWIICKTHEDGKGMHALDEKGQCVIHLAAALGYEWAIGPIVASGLSPNFRDARGKTALHWASFYGREETVIALLKLGAYPGAVDDPTVLNPGGQTAADLASSRGHKGIAGYLAEADLTSHLSVLSVNENVMNNVAATDSAQVAFETSVQSVLPTNRTVDEDHSLRGSLAAFRKSAHAAALIQGAFRARSFRQRQLTVSNNEAHEDSFDLVALGASNKGQKSSHFQDYLHSAATKIQHKYRGWTGRNQFKMIRNHVVKIQAHVRGHQVRKQYKKVVWSVGIVEKAILRWRRKSRGLRGFRTETAIGSVAPEVDKNDDYDFLRIGRKQKVVGIEKALARVQSMVRNAEARDQYMRLVSKSEKLNKEDSSKLTELRPSEDKLG